MTSKIADLCDTNPSEGENIGMHFDTLGAPISNGEHILDLVHSCSSAGVIDQIMGAEEAEGIQSSVGVENPGEEKATDYRQVESELGNLPPNSAFTPETRRSSVSVLQEWEGYVTDVGDSSFTARLVDLTEPSETEEEAEFSFDELSEDDKTLVKPGAVFRWFIAHERMKGGTKRRVSEIFFRRLPCWTQRELDINHERAAQIGALLRGEPAKREARE